MTPEEREINPMLDRTGGFSKIIYITILTNSK